jgi:GcrA cell cycle regulator
MSGRREEGPVPPTVADGERVLQMWSGGATARGIGTALALGEGKVRAIVRQARRAGDPRATRHAPGSPPSWDAAKIAALTALWSAGRSASEIARAMGGGLTRNAVIGKVHRLRLPERAAHPPGGRPRPAAASGGVRGGTNALAVARARDRARERARERAATDRSSPPAERPRGGAMPRASLPPAESISPSLATFDVPARGRFADGGPAATSSEPLPSDAALATLVDRGRRQCAFVIGEPAGAETRMCGARTVPRARGPYCAFHLRLAYLPLPPLPVDLTAADAASRPIDQTGMPHDPDTPWPKRAA